MLDFFIYQFSSYFTLAMCSLLPSFACASSAEPPAQLALQLPAGFEVSIYAKLTVAPRMMAFSPDGDLFVTSAKSNQVLMLRDSDHNGSADLPIIIASNLNAPSGLTFVDGDLLVANQDGVVKLIKEHKQWSKPIPFISRLARGGHTLKTLKLGPDAHLYLNVGSSCNVCDEEDPTRATLLRYAKDGKPAGALAVVGRHTSFPPIWATGLRNAQGFAWHPETHVMFATNNGADMRSDLKGGPINDLLPPEQLSAIKAGANYGWPHCWGNASGLMTTDPNFPGPATFCQKAIPPSLLLPSHSTPIGITFLTNSHFPEEWMSDAIVALHGSWNREQLSGYKLVRIQFKQGEPTQISDFATGWRNNNRAWGRPVDVVVGPDGALYVSDDKTGYIYRIIYTSTK